MKSIEFKNNSDFSKDTKQTINIIISKEVFLEEEESQNINKLLEAYDLTCRML